MNQKTSRNEKHKHSNKEKLVLGGDKNTNALINIAKEDDSNIFELLKNLCKNIVRFIILRCSRFCLLVTCFYFTFTVYTNFLNAVVSLVRKGKKKAI